jgi:hypothetical protein
VQIERLVDELSTVRAETGVRLAHSADESSHLRAQLSERDTQVTDFQARLEQHAAAYSEAQMKLVRQQAALVETHSSCLGKDEIINWIQTSRSWRVAASLQRLSRLPYRWREVINKVIIYLTQVVNHAPVNSSTIPGAGLQ